MGETRGRKSFFTQDRLDIFYKALLAGNFRNTAAKLAGISEATIKVWMKRKEQKFREFQDKVREIEAKVEASMVAKITDDAKNNSKWASWWLRSKCYQRWSPVERIEVDALKKHVKILTNQINELQKTFGADIESVPDPEDTEVKYRQEKTDSDSLESY